MGRPIPQKARIPGKARIRLRPARTAPNQMARSGRRCPPASANRIIFTDWAAI